MSIQTIFTALVLWACSCPCVEVHSRSYLSSQVIQTAAGASELGRCGVQEPEWLSYRWHIFLWKQIFVVQSYFCVNELFSSLTITSCFFSLLYARFYLIMSCPSSPGLVGTLTDQQTVICVFESRLACYALYSCVESSMIDNAPVPQLQSAATSLHG